MKQEKYNGYTNRMTWCLSTWINNDESTQIMFQDKATDFWKNCEDKCIAVDDIAIAIRQWFEDECEANNKNLFMNIIFDMIDESEINFLEIAETFFED